jgi:hypothetical protein
MNRVAGRPHGKINASMRCRRCRTLLTENRGLQDWLCIECAAPPQAPPEIKRDLRRTTLRPLR